MGIFRLLVTGAAVAAAVHYATKKRPDGTSIADDIKAKVPDWKNQAEPYISRIKDEFNKFSKRESGRAGDSSYPNGYNNFSPDPDPGYSS